MASQVVMPKMSDTMEEGIVVKWLKREGERVETGEALAEIETDKAVLELEAYASGVLRKILAQEDSKVPVGDLIAVIASEDEDISGLVGVRAATLPPQPAQATIPLGGKVPPLSESQVAAVPTSARPTPQEAIGRERIDASPLARRMAEEAGIDIAQVRGTGPGGRVVKRDIEAFMEQEKAQAPQRPATPTLEPAPAVGMMPQRPAMPVHPAAKGDYEDRELSLMRKTIARRMVQSKTSAPHFYITAEIDMELAIALRKSLNELVGDDSKISFNDLILKAAALTLRRFPQVNVSYIDDKIRMHQPVHIGMAVALEEGLITPVIRNCDRKSLGEIAREARELSERARMRRLKPEEYTGGTFSISNLGMFGVEDFGAIINPPEAAILAVGAIKEQPVVVDGQLAVGHRMKVTLSCDHRAIDGATAAQFLQVFKQLLEQPLQLML
ncbi:MAG: pyruvate dehydrogenase complex dihydrolipoamide acetyltransferase [Nitrospinae bacterium]|nr:pyruvate dehydrogenase complex dihydrolipoamide acetyltransferase [Nitrospinota bacterium]